MFPADERPGERSGRFVTLRRFVVAWTVVAVVAWLYMASWGDTDCHETDFICFSQREVDLIAAVVVGIPWVAGLLVAVIVAAIVRRTP